MSTSVNNPAASRVWFEKDSLWLELRDGRLLAVPLAYFPRLENATAKQRSKFELSGGGTGIHWDDLDEDISVSGLLAGRGDQTVSADRGRAAANKSIRRYSKQRSSTRRTFK